MQRCVEGEEDRVAVREFRVVEQRNNSEDGEAQRWNEQNPSRQLSIRIAILENMAAWKGTMEPRNELVPILNETNYDKWNQLPPWFKGSI